ncbi:hypothetical protein I79_010052 [Cricetulus griseus]|uniref:Small conductance calcium-activated potassium channel protein 2 n=1 Tax=Cricetulus griseus TaxID=10029 RepID=G3HHF1_CRIGR|nr:hypothetical protein I79_010052 [Cricetulus griseus]ERE84283.1 small conductance calcium-activated potassium channel protein 2 [Cricetulus griseus]
MKSRPEGMKIGDLAPHLPAVTFWWILSHPLPAATLRTAASPHPHHTTWTKQKIWPRGTRCRTDSLTNSAMTAAQIQGFELASSNIYPIHELLELKEGQVLRIQSSGSPQGNNRTSERSPGSIQY